MNSSISFSDQGLNQISQGLCYSAIDLLGRDDFESNMPPDGFLKSFLRKNFIDSRDLNSFFNHLLGKYEKDTANGISQRMGMVFFHYLRRKFRGEVLYEDLDFKLKLFHERVMLDFKIFFNWLRKKIELNPQISKQGKTWLVELSYRSSKNENMFLPFFYKGIIQELFTWLDCHYRYQIRMVKSSHEDECQIKYEITYFPVE